MRKPTKLPLIIMAVFLLFTLGPLLTFGTDQAISVEVREGGLPIRDAAIKLGPGITKNCAVIRENEINKGANGAVEIKRTLEISILSSVVTTQAISGLKDASNRIMGMEDIVLDE